MNAKDQLPNKSSSNAQPLKLSAIIPTLNEAPHIKSTLAPLLGQSGVEVIVVDGGSSDATVALARQAGVDRVITTDRPCRSLQLNAGAKAASGDVLLFLHADTRLSRSACQRIRHVMRDTQIAGGAMKMRIDSDKRSLRWIAMTVNLRTRWFGLPYGDQGIFVRRSAFESMAGFADVPIMEDYILVRRMGTQGKKVLIDEYALTSGRRWEAAGVVRTTVMNWLAVLLYHAGVKPERIRRTYDHWLSKPRQQNSRPAPQPSPSTEPVKTTP